jgi:hypothetical protein
VKLMGRATKPLPMKVLYTATELSASLGISRHMLFELVRVRGMVTYRLERNTLIPLSEIKDKLEPVWDAILLTEQNRR